MLIGLWYKNYTNTDGTLADGTCCDHPSLTAPNCPADQCDTNFMPCATYVGGKQCAAYAQTATATTYNVNSFVVNKQIGNLKGKTSPAKVVFIYPFSSEVIEFNIIAREITGWVKQEIASFTFTVDWLDTFFSDDLHWRSFLLKDTRAQLGLEVVRQCANRYFGPICSVYCKPTSQYTCLNDGSKNCTKGWQGLDCTDLVPYCTGGLCQNGGSCTNIHLDYICSCRQSYTGRNCENQLPTLNFTSTSPVIANTSTPNQPSGTESNPPAIVPGSGQAKSPSLTNPSAPSSVPGGRQGVQEVALNPSLTEDRSALTPQESAIDDDVNTIAAVTVPIGLLLLGCMLAVSVYIVMRKNKLYIRKKVKPSPPADTTLESEKKTKTKV